LVWKMSSGGSSKDEKAAGTSKESSNEVERSESCKRKRTQISLLEYFSKRKKPKGEVDLKGVEASKTMCDDSREADVQLQRELLASAAEKRFGLSPRTDDNSEDSPNFEDQGACSSYEINLSQPLFGMSPGNKMDSEEDNMDSVGIPASFQRLPDCSGFQPILKPQPDHTILFRPHIQATEVPTPYPDRYRDAWDRNHVRMPCSKENLYPTKEKKIRKRWELIEETLVKPIRSSRDFQNAIMAYNIHYKDKWDFEGWHAFCNFYLSVKEKDEILNRILPEVVVLALRLPSICTQPPPLLKRQNSHRLTLSQHQAACLLANAFFCTFPRRNSQKNSEYSAFPDINFNRLFRGTKDVVNKAKAEKLKTILHYFKRVTADMPVGTITYSRQVIAKERMVEWESGAATFKNLYVTPKGTIEDGGNGFLQVDFANRLVGGGVIGEGCVQEEIRFLICPELILSRLFVERLDPNETLLVTGVERFSSYSGYAQTYKFQKDYIDLTPRDRWGRRFTELVAMDAHVFHIYADQFSPAMLKRELNKANCAFASSIGPDCLPAIATGNWGCGAFGGDARLKALIQLMAAAVSSRDMVYFTFGDVKLSRDLSDFHAFLLENRVTVRELWTLLQNYEKELKQKDDHIELYPYLRACFSRSIPDSNPEGILVSVDNDGNDANHRTVTLTYENTESATDQDSYSDKEGIENEPLGCAPGEAGLDASPDYRIDTP